MQLDQNVIEKANADIEKRVQEDKIKLNSKAYHYNDSPRIVEGWKFSEAIKEIVNNKKMNEILTYCYQSKPIPF